MGKSRLVDFNTSPSTCYNPNIDRLHEKKSTPEACQINTLGQNLCQHSPPRAPLMMMSAATEVLYMLDVTKGVLTHFTSDLSPLSSAALGLASLVVAYWSARSAWLRWLTLRAHSPLPLFTRLLSGFVQAYSYDEEGFYGADGAPPEVQERRRHALEELKQRFDAQVGPKAAQLNERLRELSDIRFTDTNRVPHCFQPVMRAKLRLGFISVASDGPYLTDVDGNRAVRHTRLQHPGLLPSRSLTGLPLTRPDLASDSST